MRRLKERRQSLLGGVKLDSARLSRVLLVFNSGVVSLLGFCFWAVAARLYSPSDVGRLSGLTATVVLLSTISLLGLPNLLLRGLAGRGHFPVLISTLAVALFTAPATFLSLAVLHSLLPNSYHAIVSAVTPCECAGIVFLAAVSSLCDATLIGERRVPVVVAKGAIVGVGRLVALIGLVSLGTPGLFGAYAFGGLLGIVGLWPLRNQLGFANLGQEFSILLCGLRQVTGNYFGTLVGIMPSTVVPLVVLNRYGANNAAVFNAAFLLIAFLNFVPSAASQVLISELANRPHLWIASVRRTTRTVYLQLLPFALLLCCSSPLIGHVFGAEYEGKILPILFLLTGATLPSALSYVIDATLSGLQMAAAYALNNGVNTVFVLLAVLSAHSLNATAANYALAQFAAMGVGLLILYVKTRKVSTLVATYGGAEVLLGEASLETAV